MHSPKATPFVFSSPAALPGAAPALIEKTAVSFQGKSLSYRALEQRSESLAQRLCDLGIPASDTLGKPAIAVSLERGIDAVVAILAILKSGYACVPIDPAHPTSYKQAALAKSGAGLMLVEPGALTDDLPVRQSALAPLEGGVTSASSLETEHPAGQTDLLLFTSGTTGEPKGVMLSLAGVVQAAKAFARRIDICSSSVVAQFAGLSFDAAVFEILLAYLHGARLEILPETSRQDMNELSTSLDKGAITHLLLPAALAPYLPLRKHAALQALVCIGDALDERVFWSWAELCPTFNGYGPSEASICTSLHAVVPREPVTLGEPLDHISWALGGPEGKELLISGPGLSLGYAGDLWQTNARFQTGADGKIWYHSGDQVEEVNSSYRFAGRRDFQVKIRGTRVETGALERFVKSLSNVEDAAIVTCGADADRFLAAFVASEHAQEALIPAIKQEISRSFPSAYLPAVILVRPRLPMTVNQKIDRAALRRQAETAPIPAQDQLPQSTRDRVHAAFQRELKQSDFQDEEDFFNLGGDSIGAMRLLARLAEGQPQQVSVQAFRKRPTVAALTALIEQETAAETAITRGQRSGETAPLSRQQLTAWYMHQQDPASKAYLAEAIHHFEGPLDRKALTKALNKIFERHEIYRSTFSETPEGPQQQISAEYRPEILEVDGTEIAATERQDFLQQVFKEHLPGVADLGQLPLANFVLVRFSSEAHAFLHQEHHIVHDGWGGSLFTSELMQWYRHFCDPAHDFAPPLPAQNTDFVLTQSEWLQSPEATEQLKYWEKTLKGAPQRVEIFGKSSRTPGFEGSYQRLDISRQDWERCEDRCRALGITPFAFCTGVLKLCLWQHSGQEDIVIGSPFANRNWQNSQDILGMLVNTLVLRQRIGQDMAADAFLQETQRVIDGAYANQELPFGTLVEQLNPDRQGGQNPLFNVLLGFHDAPLDPVEIDGFSWRKDETVISHTSKFDLDCLVVNRKSHFRPDQAVSFLWEYRSDIYEAAEIALFVESFQHIFTALSADCSPTLATMQARAPRQIALQQDWGQGPQPVAQRAALFGEEGMVQALLRLCKQRTNGIALCSSDRDLSYAELDQMSAALAAKMESSLHPNAPVAIHAQRGIPQVIAMLAVLRLNATVVCLDPSLPLARKEMILRDCTPALLLHEGALPEALNTWPNLDITGQQPAAAPPAPRAYAPDHIAYVTYTSGSTGTPKGVEVLASSLADECLHLMEIMQAGEDTTGLSLSYSGFDAYQGEIWPILLAGGRVVLISDQERDDPGRLSDIMAAQGVTCACLPTGLFEEAYANGFAWPGSLKVLAAGGDRLGNIRIEADEQKTIWNLYGPSEAAIDASCYQLQPGTAGVPPIGRPAAFTTLKVLDGDRPCAIGAPGELVIGGSGIAKGYLNRPDETAARFQTGPNGTRIYRTGDLVRWNIHGQLEFLGRLDDEIQLRGHRISPAEITSALQGNPEVAQAAAAAKDGALFAYVTLTRETRQALADAKAQNKLVRRLKSGLKKLLPKYMQPNSILVLEQMPLTDQGKIDLRALPSPLAQEERFTPPAAGTEQELAALWQAALGSAELSATVNFFSAGGHSLLAMRLITSIREQFSVTLSIGDFFDRGTIREMAGQIDLMRLTPVAKELEALDEGEF